MTPCQHKNSLVAACFKAGYVCHGEAEYMLGSLVIKIPELANSIGPLSLLHDI